MAVNLSCRSKTFENVQLDSIADKEILFVNNGRTQNYSRFPCEMVGGKNPAAKRYSTDSDSEQVLAWDRRTRADPASYATIRPTAVLLCFTLQMLATLGSEGFWYWPMPHLGGREYIKKIIACHLL